MADYKSAKEAFHADNPGSSVHYINAISVTALVSWPVEERGMHVHLLAMGCYGA